MILNFKRWSQFRGKISEANYDSIFERQSENLSVDWNAMLIKLLSNPATRGTVIKRINAAIKKKLIDDTTKNPSVVEIGIDKVDPAARTYLDSDFPPKIKVKISSLIASEGESKNEGGILNLFRSKKKVSDGWVGIEVKYVIDLTIDEVLLTEMFTEEERTIKDISGEGILRGKLIQSETELNEKGEPMWITQWELIDIGINFTKKLDDYKAICKSKGAGELAGKKLSNGTPIDPESMIMVNEIEVYKSTEKITGPSYFLSAGLFKQMKHSIS